jgi:hypothetical protein
MAELLRKFPVTCIHCRSRYVLEAHVIMSSVGNVLPDDVIVEQFRPPNEWTCPTCQRELDRPDPLDVDDDEWAVRNAVG